MAKLDVQLLGDFGLVYDGVSVTRINMPRLQSLLAYLLLHRNTPQSRTQMAYLFWPDSTEARASGNLRRLVHRLRQTLPNPDHYLDITAQTLQWQPDADYVLDVAEFETAASRVESLASLQRAASLYRGDLLPGCYDDWIQPERERLRRLYVAALERLIELQEAERDYRAAIGHAQRLLQHDPLREETYRTLMRLHALNDDRASALQYYHACVATLQQELDVEPDEATQEAYRRLLGTSAPPAPPLTAMPPLIGRSNLWQRSLQIWRKASLGRPHLLLMTGDAGIGKTRLGEELTAWARRQGIATASARCYSAERNLAYAPVSTWLRELSPLSAEPVWLTEVSRLVPDLVTDQPDLAAPGPLEESWQRQRFFEALARVVTTHQPLLLFLDDIHWCDDATVEWLSYFLRFDPAARLLVVGTLREAEMPDERSAPLFSLLTHLRRNQQLSQFELRPLDASETATLAASVTGRPLSQELAQWVFDETEGNPLYILETVRAGLPAETAAQAGRPTLAELAAAHVPSASALVQAVIAARLERLSPAAYELAGLASTIGRAFSFAVLAHASRLSDTVQEAGRDSDDGRNDETILRGLDELLRQRIIREQGSATYDFSHGKLAEVAYAQLNAARRQLFHRRVAIALEHVHSSDLDAVAGPLADHFERAGLQERAIPYLLRAGDAAQSVYANENAIEFFQRLLRPEFVAHLTIARTCDVMQRLGHLWQLTGKWAEAEKTLREAVALVESTQDQHIRARCYNTLGRLLTLKGEYEEAWTLLTQAHAAFVQLEDQAGIGEAASNMGTLHYYQGEYDQALTFYQQRLQIAEQAGDRRSLFKAIGNLGIVYWSLGDFAQAMDYYQQNVAIARELGDREGMGVAILNMALVYRDQGEYARAWTCLTKELELALELGHRWGLCLGIGHAGDVARCRGDFAVADHLLSRAIQLAATLDSPYVLCEFLNAGAVLYFREAEASAGPLRRDSYVQAEQVNARALQIAAQLKHRHVYSEATLRSVRLRVLLGELYPTQAMEELQSLLRQWTEPSQQAAIHFEIWRLDHAQEAHRQIAAEQYRKLYARTPEQRYRERYSELTGGSLPAPPPLPDVPDIVRESSVDMAQILAQIDQVVTDMGAENAD